MTAKELSQLEKLLGKYRALLKTQSEGLGMEIVDVVTRWVKSDKEDAK